MRKNTIKKVVQDWSNACNDADWNDRQGETELERTFYRLILDQYNMLLQAGDIQGAETLKTEMLEITQMIEDEQTQISIAHHIRKWANSQSDLYHEASDIAQKGEKGIHSDPAVY